MNIKNFSGLNQISFNKINIFVFSFLVFCSCASNEVADSADVNQDRIYMRYLITYNAKNHNEFNHNAQFRFGGSRGTTLILSEPAYITVNDREMDLKVRSLRGAFYTAKTQLDEKLITYEYADTEGEKYINHVEVVPISLRNKSEISINSRTNIYFEGEPIGRNDKILLEITDNEGNTNVITNSTYGSNYIVVKPSHLEMLKPGAGEMSVTRSTRLSLKESTSMGGLIKITYTALNESIKITE